MAEDPSEQWPPALRNLPPASSYRMGARLAALGPLAWVVLAATALIVLVLLLLIHWM